MATQIDNPRYPSNIKRQDDHAGGKDQGNTGITGAVDDNISDETIGDQEAGRAMTLEYDDSLAEAQQLIWYEDEDGSGVAGWPIASILNGLVILAWSGLFIWLQKDAILSMAIPADRLVTMISQWASVPLLSLLVFYLWRSASQRQLARFGRQAAVMRAESERLDRKMGKFNRQIIEARAALAEQAALLEGLAQHSLDALGDRGAALQLVLDDAHRVNQGIAEASGQSLERFEKISDAAPRLEQMIANCNDQLDRAGSSAEQHILNLQSLYQQLAQSGDRAGEQIDGLEQKAGQSEAILSQMLDKMAGQLQLISGEFTEMVEQSDHLLGERVGALRSDLDQVASNIQRQTQDNREALELYLSEVGAALETMSQTSRQTQARITSMGNKINEHLHGAEIRLDKLDNKGGEAIARMAFALSALEDNLSKLSERLDAEAEHGEAFDRQTRELIVQLDMLGKKVREDLGDAFGWLEGQGKSSQQLVAQLQLAMEEMQQMGLGLGGEFDSVADRLANQQREFERLDQYSRTAFAERLGELGQMLNSMRELNREGDAMAELSEDRLVTSLQRARELAGQTAERLGAMIERSGQDALASLIEGARGELNDKLRGEIEQNLREIDALIAQSMGAIESASSHISERIETADQQAMRLEQRVEDAHQQAKLDTDDGFARRMAQINEALNSASIDLSKSLSQEVPDTGWAAYLRGDRSMFTRKAVRLIDGSQQRDLAALYESDGEFYETVNRFIHDFEAMLRNVMATRDGHVLSVTLLSSDIGKLYVALAQAIERFRE